MANAIVSMLEWKLAPTTTDRRPSDLLNDFRWSDQSLAGIISAV
jgi:hypothetical protein